MSKAVKYILGGALGVWLLSKLVTNGAAVKGLSEKFALMIGFPSFNFSQFSLTNQSLPLEFNNIRILNQSPFGASIENLYINVQYYSISQAKWINWIMQHKSTASFFVAAGDTTQVPPVKLVFPLTLDFISKAYKGDIGNQIQVVANFNFYGVPISIVDQTDISSVLNIVKQSNLVVA